MIRLSTTETEILRLICEDMACKEIGHSLGISAKTVAVHKFNIRKKLGVFGDIGLYRKAILMGITPVPQL